MLLTNRFPALYPILDAAFLTGAEDRAGFLRRLVWELAGVGVGILQYRNKTGGVAEILADARVMREAGLGAQDSGPSEPTSQKRDPSASSGQAMGHPHRGAGLRASVSGQSMLLILNDWPELAVEAGFDGVHVGQTDLSPAEARAIVGPGKIVGVSTHNEAQLRTADREPVDYIAFGPVFATGTKANPDPVVGLEGLRAARGLTRKPLVAIGGITLENAASVREAGADSVAVISAIFSPGGSAAKLAGEFLQALEKSGSESV